MLCDTLFVMLSIVMLNVVMLGVMMLCVAHFHAECRNAKCRYAECQGAMSRDIALETKAGEDLFHSQFANLKLIKT